MTALAPDLLPRYVQTRIDLYQLLQDSAVTSTERAIVNAVKEDFEDILDGASTQLARYIRTRIDIYLRLSASPVTTRVERSILEGAIADMQTIIDTLEVTE